LTARAHLIENQSALKLKPYIINYEKHIMVIITST
jgi:hypothetical protein